MLDTAPPAEPDSSAHRFGPSEDGRARYGVLRTRVSGQAHLVADLSVAYAFDEPKCFVMVARRDLVRLRLDNRSIHGLAIANLLERIKKLEPEFRELSNGVFILAGAGDFTAATLLLDDVWRQATDRLHEGLLVRGPLVAAVPARDMVAFTRAENRQGLTLP